MNVSRRKFLGLTVPAIMSVVFYKTLLGNLSSARADTMNKGKTPVPNGKMEANPRVVSVHSPSATGWDFKTYPYVDHIDEGRVAAMLDEAVKALAGAGTVAASWQNVFNAYKPGDTIVIKPNFNDLYDGFNGYVASPAIINAIIGGLVRDVKVNPDDITVYDCTRIIPDEFRSRVRRNVRFIEPYGSSMVRKLQYKTLGNSAVLANTAFELRMTSRVTDKSGKPVKCYMPNVVTGADHIINVPILKAHQFVSHSGALKNHYGTVRFSDGHTGPEYLHPPIINESIVDINADSQIKDKTRLVVLDALFGRLNQYGGPPEQWNIFGKKSPNRVIVSKDPVALDTVSCCMLEREFKARGEDLLPHDYLHMAQERGLGVHEDPKDLKTFSKIRFIETEI